MIAVTFHKRNGCETTQKVQGEYGSLKRMQHATLTYSFTHPFGIKTKEVTRSIKRTICTTPRGHRA